MGGCADWPYVERVHDGILVRELKQISDTLLYSGILCATFYRLRIADWFILVRDAVCFIR
jgi:hypothetical protein